MLSNVVRLPVLGILLGFDLCILLLYAGDFFLKGLSSPLFLIGDWSVGEIFNYCKELLLFILSLWLVKATKQPLFVAWSLVFIYLLVDDALGLHELFGFLFHHLVPTASVAGLDSRNIGEFLFFVLAGSVLLTFLWQAHRYSQAPSRTFTWSLLPWLALLVFCGVFIDAVHILFMENSTSDFIFTLLEDGGEMVVLSIMVWKTLLFFEKVKGNYQNTMNLKASRDKE